MGTQDTGCFHIKIARLLSDVVLFMIALFREAVGWFYARFIIYIFWVDLKTIRRAVFGISLQCKWVFRILYSTFTIISATPVPIAP